MDKAPGGIHRFRAILAVFVAMILITLTFAVGAQLRRGRLLYHAGSFEQILPIYRP
jgi:hypothetical protein